MDHGKTEFIQNVQNVELKCILGEWLEYAPVNLTYVQHVCI